MSQQSIHSFLDDEPENDEDSNDTDTTASDSKQPIKNVESKSATEITTAIVSHPQPIADSDGLIRPLLEPSEDITAFVGRHFETHSEYRQADSSRDIVLSYFETDKADEEWTYLQRSNGIHLLKFAIPKQIEGRHYNALCAMLTQQYALFNSMPAPKRKPELYSMLVNDKPSRVVPPRTEDVVGMQTHMPRTATDYDKPNAPFPPSPYYDDYEDVYGFMHDFNLRLHAPEQWCGNPVYR